MNLKQALASLQPNQDNHWTSDGLPRVDAVSEILGAPTDRRQITAVAPMLTRGSATPVGTPEHEKEKEDADKAPVAPDNPCEPDKPDPVPETEEAAPGTVEPTDPERVPDEAQSVAFVKIEDDVVGMKPTDVLASIELIDRSIAEFGRQAGILCHRRESIATRLKDIGRRSAMLSAHRNRLSVKTGHDERDRIKRYQKSAQKAREEKAARARKFLESGTTAEDVRAQLQVASPIDAAMKQRKPSRGGVRPVYPKMMGV